MRTKTQLLALGARLVSPSALATARLSLCSIVATVMLAAATIEPMLNRAGPAPAAHAATADYCDESQGQVVTDTLSSAVYERPVPYTVYLPPCYDNAEPPLPVIYLLHGGGGNQNEWSTLGVAALADRMIAQGAPPFLVVMPGGEYLFPLNYEAFVLRDLLPNVQCRYRARGDTAGQTIGGISLGGYWALRTAFEHPHMFATVGGHSPVLDLGGPDDPWVLATTISNTERLPVMLDAGTDDSLFFSTRVLANTLRKNGVAVSFAAYPGAHEPSYWMAHAGEYLSGYLQATTHVGSWPGWLLPPRACVGRAYLPGLG